MGSPPWRPGPRPLEAVLHEVAFNVAFTLSKSVIPLSPAEAEEILSFLEVLSGPGLGLGLGLAIEVMGS